MESRNILYMNTTVLAFLGDTVYETFIRRHVIEKGQINADMLHRAAVRFVRADAGICAESDDGRARRAGAEPRQKGP
jgi:23S rRNA maturation mini-RNase III